MTFKIDQKTDCDINNAEELCKVVFERNNYLVKIKDNKFSFLRKTNKSNDRLMPIYELLRGFSEGKITFTKQNDFLKVKVSHRWIMHSFTSLLLIGMFTLVFAVHSDNFKFSQLIFSLCIVSPISILGYYKAKDELQELFDDIFNLIKKEYNIIHA